MATTAQSSTPFSRLSRIGLGLGLKSSTGSSSRARESQKQEDWYIPYSGPYEPPRESFRRRKERDSWGDPIDGEEDEDVTALTSHEHHRRDGSGDGTGMGLGMDGGGLTASQRIRTQSGISRRSTYSSVVESNGTGIPGQRRSTISSSHHPPGPSYATFDAGGVGESPAPPTHRRSSSKEINRTSIVGLFTFGSQARNRTPSEKGARGLFTRKLSTRSAHPSPSVGAALRPSVTAHRRSSSTGSNSLLGHNTQAGGNHNGSVEGADNDDYYNSYYFSTQPSVNANPDDSIAQPTHPYGATSNTDTPKTASSSPSPSPSSRHPYAYAFPASRVDNGPLTAPLPSDTHASYSREALNPPRLTFNEPQPPSLQRVPASAGVIQNRFPVPRYAEKGIKPLKNSTSTPELRLGPTISAANSPSSRSNVLPAKPSPTSKVKDRWLSAETWCDAILFPRPRLKVKQNNGAGKSGRIVSPPDSPVLRAAAPTENGVPEQGVSSRVLAHSRSLVELSQTNRDAIVEPTSNKNATHALNSTQAEARPSQIALAPLRPKSWALDDLALPTPVPSLSLVLEENERFTTQRKQWQEQATHSFQNKITRSISRSRSKSLTGKGRRNEDPRPSNMNFLAAKAYLGNQLVAPMVTLSKSPEPLLGPSAVVTRPSHTQSNSLVKSLSKSHSRGHSRSDSFGRAVLKKAKPPARGTDIGSPMYYGNSGLENALRRDDTKIIRLADPALAEITPFPSVSPTPSGSVASDARIGIALSTPPLVDIPLDMDTIRLPHPYAQAGLYSYSNFLPASQPKESDTGSSNDVRLDEEADRQKAENALALEASRQHETLASVPYHPYNAQQFSSRDDTQYAHRPAAESDIPAPSRMWAQLSPGVIREILPTDIQYSPFMSEHDHDSDDSSQHSRTINDMVGVGEALAYAVKPKSSNDSGLGTSEDHTTGESSQAVKRSRRQPVQYDAMRPSHLALQGKKPHDPHSARTFASSPLLHQQEAEPLPDLPKLDSTQSNDTPPPRTISTSPESASPSPPHSPPSFGNPDDLESFYDLFYKPSRPSTQQLVQSERSSVSASVTPSGSRRRGGSGLTSLARQLSEEFGQLVLEREESQYSRSSTAEPQSSLGRRPTDSTLEFVFEDTTPPESATDGRSPPSQSAISPFQPSSDIIPEDVESSRASSPLDPDLDGTETFRVGVVVGSNPTPPILASDPRLSYIGQLSASDDQSLRAEDGLSPLSPRPRIDSGLVPPSADPTRSSYMTTSTTSRISGLSDFPAPPRNTAGHMSLLTSYFDEAHSLSEARDSQNITPPPLPTSFYEGDDHLSQRLTTGGEEEIEELVAALSSHSHSSGSTHGP